MPPDRNTIDSRCTHKRKIRPLCAKKYQRNGKNNGPKTILFHNKNKSKRQRGNETKKEMKIIITTMIQCWTVGMAGFGEG